LKDTYPACCIVPWNGSMVVEFRARTVESYERPRHPRSLLDLSYNVP